MSHAGTLAGDALLAADFSSYAGAFNAQLREHLTADCWIPDITSRGIPFSSLPPGELLATPANKVSHYFTKKKKPNCGVH